MGLLRLAQETPEVSPETSVMDAVRMMHERSIGALVVTAGRKILGVFTERDLMRRIVFARRDPQTTAIREVMTSPVRTVTDSTPIEKAASVMRQYHIRHLALVDSNGDLLGMIAQRHILYDLLDDLERKVDGLESFIMADGPGG